MEKKNKSSPVRHGSAGGWKEMLLPALTTLVEWTGPDGGTPLWHPAANLTVASSTGSLSGADTVKLSVKFVDVFPILPFSAQPHLPLLLDSSHK